MGEPINSQTRSASVPNIILAWVAALLASSLPAAIWEQFAPEKAGDLRWLPATIWVQVGGLAFLCVVALAWPWARPMRLPVIMLLAFLVGWRILTPLVTQRESWTEWQANQSIGMSLATSRLQWLPPTVLMTMVALGARLGRRQMFLTTGDWTAPVVPELLFPVKGWIWFPRTFVLVLLLLTILPFVLGEFVLGMGWVAALRPDFNKADRMIVHFPGIVAGSVLNAISEEYIFRTVLLACFISSVGTRQALWLTAVLFGLEHWPTAAPSGIGVVLTCYWGWVCGKSMTETGGWTWAIVQHIIGDIPIFALVALARP